MGCRCSRAISTDAHQPPKIHSAEATASTASRKSIAEYLSKARPGIKNARIKQKDISQVYEILEDRVLGTGMNGKVYLARNKATGEKVAVKTLTTENLNSRKFELLRNEVEIYLHLDHPNVCRLLEVYEDNANVRLVMEACTGKELFERLASKKRYGEQDAAQVAKQMLDALHYCHKQNICHRDLKLENWVYADTSENAPLRLIDFGFSKVFTQNQPMTAMHGTVYYVAPEVLEGSYDSKCDVWSIGVIVYMILSGAPPFGGSTDAQIISNVRNGRFSFEGPRWAGISDSAKEFISFLLQRDPAKRPSAIEASKHEWITSNLAKNSSQSSEDGGIDRSVLEGLCQFSRQNGIKRAALGMIALSMSRNEMLENLEREFKSLDTDGSGTIKLQGLKEALMRYLGTDDEEAERIFKKLDQSGDDEIHYSEFLAACLLTRLAMNESCIQDVFDKLDVDKTGYISVDNLRAVLGDSFCGTSVEDLLRQVDYKCNGRIEYDEFVRALTEQREIELEAEATDPDGNVDNDYSKLDVLVRDGPVGGAKINLSQLA
ncbi:calcium-dependent protein kinase, isoform, putative [Perkinsus marinus ATCC 50983]|uniref:non-specific serine/threonine protein kinase n=1 Tax=Perkinsus marinus (strain ATCC 50983 / TXsc) TaxID=423536 RepID=C5KBX2_PERM5|nr:calcium-dependent protein kinase, isoform, putative [Perkinsus marinus ATCC 50983]EER18003.1 calcium-dependent protein kinase, isoform, putative [Perkinsus marinus ATCC 50983]|eukprot:XP_002786207.1 calcium-dependent protein kinase, isoform, putative [Perkinsus marinus ATCC 50983]